MVQNNKEFNLRDLAAVGLLAVGLYEIFKGDTVVYYLYKRSRIVYIGVTYKHRLEQRLDEHDRNGVIDYDTYDHSSAMSRASALVRERKDIRLYSPKYNVHHNYC